MDYRPFVKDVLLEASGMAQGYFGKTTGWAKDGDPQLVLTEADLAVAKFLVSAVRKRFPGHNVIDEEFGAVDNHSDYTWAIDPIDGTSNFAAGVPLYGVIVGLMHNDRPLAGGFALPAFSEIYLAQRGKGATLNGETVQVTRERDLRNALVALGMHAKSQEGADEVARIAGALIRPVRYLRSGGSLFDIAMAAKGSYGAVASTRGHVWDCVGPQIVLEEAGGVFTHMDGRTISYEGAINDLDRQYSYFMGSPEIHRQVLAIMRAHMQKSPRAATLARA